MGLPLAKEDKKYTYDDYLEWPDEERWEIIEGVPYCLSPGPSARHQRIFGDLFLQIKLFLRSHECETFSAPFDVLLTDEDDEAIRTVVQPDISVICDPSKIEERGCLGAPDFIIEILSPSTKDRDMGEKTFLYQKHGVREYWIVDPEENLIRAYLLDESGKYNVPRILKHDAKAEVSVLPGLQIDLALVFAEPTSPEQQNEA